MSVKDSYNFEYYPENDTGTEIRLNCEGDLTLNDFVNMCRSFAIALGYNQTEIDKCFSTSFQNDSRLN